ncbi:sulfite oxidase-like oxidoreductase [Pacificimonas flava]|uniref:Sulfite oxidase-like oxidoreductase n=2 Tax=Pacificimonas TaxID=1960290 RepID=A0A219B7T8_9SPHN|nr:MULTISPECIES: sulfite oxidase-like oxidoreductase [Pacificimonas]MBZ6378538.1 sulfite oxidase-like oxidoreductase [Pacificimonas aurantium]OWV34176.1 sulfite oxidase-like oxidoreductase [Pacificimonas flava]
MTGELKTKLIETKKAWARAGRLLTGKTAEHGVDRLPPGQRLVENWPVLDLGIQPHVPRDDWRLSVGGLVETELAWGWDDLLRQPQVEMVSDIHCVTQWSRYDNRWTGVTTRHLAEMVTPKPEARFVLLSAYDGYTTNLRIEDFLDEDCLLAHAHDGEQIEREHGGPVRLVVPRYYFWKSPKWLKRITFAAEDKPGFWEERGYHNVGDPWLEQRYE